MFIKVFLIDDHRLMLEALTSLFATQKEILVIGKAGLGEGTIPAVKKLKPNVVVLGAGMPSLGIVEIARSLQRISPRPGILVISASTDYHFLLVLLHAGVTGIAFRNYDFKTLLTAIVDVAGGRRHLAPEVLDVLLDKSDSPEFDGKVAQRLKLSCMEQRVLELVVDGKAIKECASSLCRSSKTIEKTRRQLMKKLNIASIAELTKYAVREGLTSPWK